MIHTYGYSITGKSHLKKGVPCQDAHCIQRHTNDMVIAAVADGVGSAKYSDKGASIAAERSVQFCMDYIPMQPSDESLKALIRLAFHYALRCIKEEADAAGVPHDEYKEYDTTLSLAIYRNGHIVFGHVGDGGIVGLSTAGTVKEITKPQKGEFWNSVIPLRFGEEYWVIESCGEELASVLLMTDGLRDAMCPSLLRLGSQSKVYTPLAYYFADPLAVPETDEEQQQMKEKLEAALLAQNDYNADEFYQRLKEFYKMRIPEKADELITEIEEQGYVFGQLYDVTDDKTIVGILNAGMNADNLDEAFYRETDWDSLKEIDDRMSYPHLYDEKKEPEPGADKTVGKKVNIFKRIADLTLRERKKDEIQRVKRCDV